MINSLYHDAPLKNFFFFNLDIVDTQYYLSSRCVRCSVFKIRKLSCNKNGVIFPRPQCLFSSQVSLAGSQMCHQACALIQTCKHATYMHMCARAHTDTFPTSSNPILSGYLGTTETNWEGSIGGRSTGRHKKHTEHSVSERLREQNSIPTSDV